MAKSITARAVLDVVATGAVLVAAVAVIVRGGNAPNKGDGWSAIDAIQIAIGASPSIGDNQATHAVMVFSDFECPFCGVAADGLIPWLKSEYVARGQLRLVFKNFPIVQLHPNASRLARLAACASLQNDPWDVQTLLYRRMPKAPVTAESLFKSLKIDSQKLDRCAAGLGREIVEQDVEDGRKLGVSATPTFVVGTVKNDLVEAKMRLSGVVAEAVFTRLCNSCEEASDWLEMPAVPTRVFELSDDGEGLPAKLPRDSLARASRKISRGDSPRPKRPSLSKPYAEIEPG